MYKPDRVILHKVKEYDPHLFIEWNPKEEFFELWRHQATGRILVTPITRNLYDEKETRQFAPLDERLLWWIDASDSWKWERDASENYDKRRIAFEEAYRARLKMENRDRAKDFYRTVSSFYATRAYTRNRKTPSFNTAPSKNRFIMPDRQKATRIFSRGRQNALAYGYQK